jgi:glycosyltransferase involved in cell wall biosynthesis
LRILILNWRDLKNPTAGGAEVAVDNIARYLAKSGNKITIFTSAYKNCRHEEDVGYAKIIRKGSMSKVYLNAFLYYRKHSKNFDAIIESVSTIPFFTPLYAKGKKLIIIPHQVTGRMIFTEAPLPIAIAAHGAENLIPSIYKNINFVVPSKSIKKDFEDFGVNPKSITSCYFNNVPSFFKKANVSKSKNPTLITVTRLVKYKRVDVLLDIVNELRKKTDIKLIIVGTGIELNNLKKKAKELGISDYVSFTGHVNDKKKAELLTQSWIFVTTSEKEGFGISALEAQKCGTPVVAFANGGLKEAVKDNYSGFLVDDMDKKGFEKALMRLIKDEALRKKLSGNSIIYANSFDTEKEIRKIEKILTK